VTTTRTAAALLLSAVLALTACGTDDDDPVTATSADNANPDAGSNASAAYAAPEVTANAADLTKEPKSGPGSGTVSKLQTKDLVVGKGKTATLSDTVTVHYVGSLFSDGSVFDSSWEGGEPISFSLAQVVPGFAQGIEGMKVGGRRQIIIPAELGYGPQEIPGIPANSDLVFIVDLKKIG
jgi:peptidylprolyl isomerase